MRRTDVEKDGTAVCVENARAGRHGRFMKITQLQWNERTGKADKVATVHVAQKHYDVFLRQVLAVLCLDNRHQAAAIASNDVGTTSNVAPHTARTPPRKDTK